MKKLGIIVGVLVVIIGVLGVIAPTDMHIEREVVIQKSKEFVFNELKSLKKQDEWSPWAKKDPNMIKGFVGVDGQVGATSTWKGNSEVGEGEQEIKKIVEGERIDYELRFKKPMEDTSTAYLITEAIDANQTKVKWGMTGHSKFPGNIFCMLMQMTKKVTAEFDQGLASLKAQLEK